MPRLKRFTAAQGRNVERQRQAWELFKYGASCSEIGKALGVHRSHAHRLVKYERDRLAGETKATAEEWRTVELARADLQVREACRIISTRCSACGGQGRLLPDGPATLPGEDDVCVSCDGSGRKYGVDYILKALDRLNRAVEQRAKLLGLYRDGATVDIHVTDGRDAQLTALLAAMDDNELQRELEDLGALPVIEMAPTSEPLLDHGVSRRQLGYHD